MEVKEIKVKSCLNKSKLTDYVINPYTGCQHACVYCYADFIRRFQNIPDKWGDFVYAKTNCVELLEKEIVKAKPGNIWLSSVCDCYMPLEAKYKLTRKILEILIKYKDKFTIEILTKSALVKRDFDLLKQLDVELGLSINSLDERFSRIIEPFAASPKLRIETLRLAKEQGIKTYGFISPVTVFTDLELIFKELKNAGVDYVWVEILNIKKSVQDRMIPIIKKNFPEKYDEFIDMTKNYEKFCDKIRIQARELEKKYKLEIKDVVVH